MSEKLEAVRAWATRGANIMGAPAMWVDPVFDNPKDGVEPPDGAFPVTILPGHGEVRPMWRKGPAVTEPVDPLGRPIPDGLLRASGWEPVWVIDRIVEEPSDE